ncbi:MAG: diguanylate cyclase [Polyangiaceae bacterium]|nr:diguanylate cyclase [Polyangiaceae bacterium]
MSASDPAPSSATILVADDDRITRELVAAMLTRLGHTVELAEDGQAAVERVGRGGIDLVLLDIMMPRLSGLEACRILKSMTADSFLPVLLLTVKTDTQSRVEGLRIGADDYVHKPFEERELEARLGAMLRIKQLYDHVLASKRKLEELSVVDGATGLYNYRYLHTRLTEEWKRAERYHDPLACALIDVDGLAAVNQERGHDAGDLVVRALADAIRRSVRDTDIVARFGGDEFLVLMPSTHFAGAVAVAERIWRSSTSRGARRPYVSIGVSLFPSRDVKTKDALLRAADRAVSDAKREGGNRICVFQHQGYIYSPVDVDGDG